jgi:hypothetical protein
MEWVSHLAGEPHGDAPVCVSPVLRSYCRALNDVLEDAPRQRLRPYLARTIGTSEDGLDEPRSWMALDWLIRIYAPSWLAAVGSTETANRLASLPLVIDAVRLKTALRALRFARRDMRVAWAATLGPARVTAWLPRAAGRVATGEAAWRSAGSPAWLALAAAVGVRKLACDKAGAICREIAGDAAATLTRQQRAAGGRSNNHGHVSAAIDPILDRLHESAFVLLEQMLPTEPLAGRSPNPPPELVPACLGMARSLVG